MGLNYDDAKKFFADKIGADWFGRGRMESAFYWTALWVWEQGYKEGLRDGKSELEKGKENGF